MKKQFGDGIAIMRSDCILELIADTTGNMGFQVLKVRIRGNRGVYLCLIFEMSIWEFITNSKKIDFETNSIFCRVRT